MAETRPDREAKLEQKVGPEITRTNNKPEVMEEPPAEVVTQQPQAAEDAHQTQG